MSDAGDAECDAAGSEAAEFHIGWTEVQAAVAMQDRVALGREGQDEKTAVWLGKRVDTWKDGRAGVNP